MKGMLFCRRGGTITIEATEPENNDGEGAEKTQEQMQTDVKQTNAEAKAFVNQALAEGKVDVEAAQFMRDGYSKAFQFANGDIDMANQFFANLTADGGDTYNSSEVQFNRFKLYLQHNDFPLTEAGCGSMKLSDSSGGSVALGDAVASTLTQSQKSTQENKGADKQAVPIITDILDHLA